MKRRNPFPGVGNKPAIDRHGKKRWRLRATVKGRKVDTYLPGPYGSAEFRAAYDMAMNPVPSAAKTRGAPGTVDRVVSHYRATKKFQALAPSTRYSKGKRLDWICEKVGRFPLANIQAHHVWHLMEQKGGAAAANRLRKEMSEIFLHGRKRMGLKVGNPAAETEEHRTKDTGGFHTWTSAEVEQFRDAHPSGSKARLALELMLATGAARQDACAMGRHNIKGDVVFYRRGKTGQEAELPLEFMPELVSELVQLPHDTGLFITHSGGKGYTPESFGSWFADQCEAAGLPSSCRAHGLRKYGATQLAENGANEFQIMAFLAHKSTREALNYVRAARRRKLASDGMAKVRNAKVSNLSDWLGKTIEQKAESKGKK